MAEKEIRVPDIGEFEDVEVIDLIVRPGDEVKVEDPLITLESDKATMDIPAPAAGVVRKISVSLGDKVSEGSLILTLDVAEERAARAREAADAEAAPRRDETQPAARASQAEPSQRRAPSGEARRAAEPPPAQAPRDAPATSARASAPADEPDAQAAPDTEPPRTQRGLPHASPSVRRLAREMGVDLSRVPGRGRMGRILKEDVQDFVKGALAGRPAAAPAARTAAAPAARPAAAPAVDFAAFGEIEVRPESRIRRTAARNLHGSWTTVPHVTQHDEADITELEAFRKAKAEEARARGVKLTLLPFVMKAAVATLRELPRMNASLEPDGERLVFKKYYHLGIAVDTEHGLVVPVIRDVDRKGLYELAAEVAEAGRKARERRLRAEDLAGATFTISSLGGIGGTAFTPIVNAPEVGVLGVSRAALRPVWRDGAFAPRLMLPLSLSYDHRVIDGAEAARFTTRLGTLLSDIRNLIL